MSNMNLRVHLCADSISGIAASVADFNTLFESRSIPVRYVLIYSRHDQIAFLNSHQFRGTKSISEECKDV